MLDPGGRAGVVPPWSRSIRVVERSKLLLLKPPAPVAEDAASAAAPGRTTAARPVGETAAMARRYMLVSIAAAVITITLKVVAYLLTDSIVCFPMPPSR